LRCLLEEAHEIRFAATLPFSNQYVTDAARPDLALERLHADPKPLRRFRRGHGHLARQGPRRNDYLRA
jgi:hypothetical protein